MFDFRDLFQWERFITPSIIKIFYWLAVGIAVLFGLSGIISGLTLMALSPLAGVFYIIASLIGDGDQRDLRAHHLRVRADHVPHQRAPRRHPPARTDVTRRATTRWVDKAKRAHAFHGQFVGQTDAWAQRLGISAMRAQLRNGAFAHPTRLRHYVANRKCMTSPSATT